MQVLPHIKIEKAEPTSSSCSVKDQGDNLLPDNGGEQVSRDIIKEQEAPPATNAVSLPSFINLLIDTEEQETSNEPPLEPSILFYFHHPGFGKEQDPPPAADAVSLPSFTTLLYDTEKQETSNTPLLEPSIPFYFHHPGFGIESCMLYYEKHHYQR